MFEIWCRLALNASQAANDAFTLDIENPPVTGLWRSERYPKNFLSGDVNGGLFIPILTMCLDV